MHSAVKIAKYFVDKSNQENDMTPMKLLKMVYIAHGWMLALYDRPLISEDVEAWKYGPVIPELYRALKKWGGDEVDELPDEWRVELDEDEQNILEHVYENYKGYSGVALSAMTHAKGTPWTTVGGGALGRIIPNEVIRNYYKSFVT